MVLRRLRTTIGGYLWGRTFAAGGLLTWLHEPVVRRSVNEAVTGSPDRWPLEWLSDRLDGRCLDRALSLGCGEGALERDLLSKGLCRTVVGIDVSRRALDLARRAATAGGFDGVSYRWGDLNRLELPARSAHAVFFHQSLHHVEALDHCLATAASAIRPGGLAYFDEYVGPARREWSRELLREAQNTFRELPPGIRRSRRLRLPVDRWDPTEAVRSSDILTAVERHFHIETSRDYGGNFLSVIYPHLDLSKLTASERDSILQGLVDAERRHLEAGARSFYAVLIATPREELLQASTRSRPCPRSLR